MEIKKVFHKKIGEEIYLAQSKSHLDDLPSDKHPLYTVQEQEVLKKQQFGVETLQAINTMKRVFEGYIVSIKTEKTEGQKWK